MQANRSAIFSFSMFTLCVQTRRLSKPDHMSLSILLDNDDVVEHKEFETLTCVVYILRRMWLKDSAASLRVQRVSKGLIKALEILI